MLDAILRIQPTSSVTHSSPISQLTTSPLSFGSRQPISTTWSGLGLSNPPSSPIHSTFIPVSTQSPASTTQTRSPLQNTTAIYSTLTSIPTSFSPLQDHTFPQFQTHPYTFSSHPASHMSYKPPKLDLPRFTGDDVVGWLAMAERYIRTQHIPPQERVTTVATHFGPDASSWMNSFEQRHPTSTWEHFVPAFLEHFGSGNPSDFKALLSHLQHTTTVDDYISEFTKLSCHAPEWSDDQLLPIFCGGLKTEI